MSDAILGTTVFGNDAPNDFGRFDQAVVTLFRVTAGLGWIDQVLPIKFGDGYVNWKVAMYVMSYIIVTNWTLLQVCVAILLDNFITANATTQQEREAEILLQEMNRKLFLNALDPLLERFVLQYNDDMDLSSRLQELFQVHHISDFP